MADITDADIEALLDDIFAPDGPAPTDAEVNKFVDWLTAPEINAAADGAIRWSTTNFVDDVFTVERAQAIVDQMEDGRRYTLQVARLDDKGNLSAEYQPRRVNQSIAVERNQWLAANLAGVNERTWAHAGGYLVEFYYELVPMNDDLDVNDLGGLYDGEGMNCAVQNVWNNLKNSIARKGQDHALTPTKREALLAFDAKLKRRGGGCKVSDIPELERLSDCSITLIDPAGNLLYTPNPKKKRRNVSMVCHNGHAWPSEPAFPTSYTRIETYDWFWRSRPSSAMQLSSARRKVRTPSSCQPRNARKTSSTSTPTRRSKRC
jgi:hypothetical protein